ncbi:MAG: energy transducer TonB [Cyclobacteriaceae bacterium]
MKNIFNMLMIATAIIAIQACQGTKEKKTEEDSAANVEQSRADRAVFLEKEKVERASLRQIKRLELATENLTYQDTKGNIIYRLAEVEPTFIGGDKAMMKYLQENLKFPEGALERGDEGTVFVDFVVEKSGLVSTVEITDTKSHYMQQSLQNEAIRVIKSMPAWQPGTQNGDAVNVKFSIPITFQMI